MNNLMYCFEGFPYPTRGGISQVSIRQSAFFQKHYSIKCYCLCLRVESECINLQTFNGYIIVDYSFNSSQKIAEYIAEKNISVVVFQVIWNFKLFSIVDKACRLSGAKLISVMHGQPKQGLINIDKYIRENKPVNLRELLVKVFRPLYLKYFYLRQRRHNLYIYNQSDRYVSLVPANEQQLIQFYHMADISKLCSIANPLSFDSFATDKQIAVQTCDEHDDKSVQFYKEKSNGVLSVRWNAKDLINTISRICDWDLSQLSYRVNGILISEMKLMLFDLNEAVTMV